MQQGRIASADENSALPFFERSGVAFLRFLGDFWLLFLFALLLGFLFIWAPQSRELWRHYILSPLPGLLQSGLALIHAAFVVAAFLFSGIVFATYAHRKVRLRQAQGRNPATWVVACAALLPLVLSLAGMGCAAADYLAAEQVRERMLLAVSISSGLIALALVTVLVSARTAGAAALGGLLGRSITRRMTAAAGLALLVMFLGLPLLPAPAFVRGAQIVGAVPAMLFSIGLVLYGIDAAFRATGYRKPLALAALTIAVAGILFGDLGTAHRVRRVGPVEKSPLPDVGSEFLRWLETRKDRDKFESYPVFIVAAQGGGLYAAYHTARVLAVLQDECPAFAQHVFAISGVSGGSLGAAVFASAVKSISPEQTLEPCREPGSSAPFLEYADRFLNRDFLSPLGFLAVIPNIAQRIAGLPRTVLEVTAPRAVRNAVAKRLRGVRKYDRALGLEYGFEQAWQDTARDSDKRANFFKTASTAAWSGEDAVPALVFNAARAATGITYSVAPFRLDRETHLDFRAKVLGVEAPRTDVSIATAVGLSARTPFITGPGMIRVAGRRWLEEDDSSVETVGLVDGAFVENSGLATVGKLVREIHDAVVRHGTRKISIHVVAIQDLSAFTYSHSGVERPPGERPVFVPKRLRDLVEAKDFDQPVRFGMAEFTAPLTALDASRSARSFYSLSSLVENVATLRCAQGVGAKDDPCTASPPSRSGKIVEVPAVGHLLFGMTANNRPLPLAWHLSSLSWLRIEKRAWAGKQESWTCKKQLAIPTGDTDLQAMNDADIAELRALGEDLGGFVDRWIYACSRDHMRSVLAK
jgi:hypothetical protein